MSDFGADVFDQDRPKGKHRGSEDERPASPPAAVRKELGAKEPVAKASPLQAASQATRAVAPGLPETPRAEAGALQQVPAHLARPREVRPAREQDRRDRDERPEQTGSRWRDDPKRIPSQPPREPADHQRDPAQRRTEPPVETQHRERHTEFRSRHEGSEGRPQRASTGREPVRPIERNTSPPAVAPQTVGLLVDLEGLQAEARAQQGELAMHRLRSGLCSGRTVAKALAIAKTAGAAPSGFDLIVSSGGFSAGVQFAAAAVELLRVAPVLVMAPTSDPIRKLATALRAAGHTVELTGFSATEAPARRLGRDCLFVP